MAELEIAAVTPIQAVWVLWVVVQERKGEIYPS